MCNPVTRTKYTSYVHSNVLQLYSTANIPLHNFNNFKNPFIHLTQAQTYYIYIRGSNSRHLSPKRTPNMLDNPRRTIKAIKRVKPQAGHLASQPTELKAW